MRDWRQTKTDRRTYRQRNRQTSSSLKAPFPLRGAGVNDRKFTATFFAILQYWVKTSAWI